MMFRAARQQPQRAQAPRSRVRPGLRVLIVDDSPTIVALLGKLLRQGGFVTIAAGDAEQGVKLAHSERPDLIFLDVVLPAMDGFAALRFLRRHLRTIDIPVIMISGNAQATEQFHAQRIGADGFMKKPFSREDVSSRIECLLSEDGTLRRRGASLRLVN